jgi:transcription elongation factor Elf1
MFVCPQCGKHAISIHRKTYEQKAIVFCTNCRLHTIFTPTQTSYYDTSSIYKEFIKKYTDTIKGTQFLAP